MQSGKSYLRPSPMCEVVAGPADDGDGAILRLQNGALQAGLASRLALAIQRCLLLGSLHGF